jgi:hypothetical protein
MYKVGFSIMQPERQRQMRYTAVRYICLQGV